MYAKQVWEGLYYQIGEKWAKTKWHNIQPNMQMQHPKLVGKCPVLLPSTIPDN